MATTPYADQTYAGTYFGERLGTSAWDSASSGNKDKALKQATRVLDTLNYRGAKSDEAQVREFPRNGESTIPEAIKEACCEVALALLQGNLIETMTERSAIASESVGDASVSYATPKDAVENQFGLPSPVAARLVAPWLVDPRLLRVYRV